MADEQSEQQREADALKRKSLRERSRQWFLTIGTVLALLATIIGFLSDSVGVLEFFSSRVEEVPSPVVDPEAFGGSGRVALEVETPLLLPTHTPLPTATATPVLTATPTPLPALAAEGERLLIIAQFSNFTVDANYNVAGRIHEALSSQVAAANLEDTRVVVWPEIVDTNPEAVEVLGLTRAAMVIWGEYDSGRVRVRFALEGGGAELDWQRLLGAPTELSTTINLDVPRETQALALMALGRLYRSAGEMTRARAAFAQALAQNPSDLDTVATLTFYLAILDAAANPLALDRSIEGYGKVIELRPTWLNARYNRGLAYLTRYWMTTDVVNLDAAIEDFSWTIEAKRNYAEAYINRAIAYYARNGADDLEASVDDLSTAIRYSPNSYRAYYNRGLAYIRLDKQENWVADLSQALEVAPEFWASHHALCWGYALDQLPDEGLAHCDEAMRFDTAGSTRDARGLVLAQLGRLDEAEVDFEQYLLWLDTQPEAWSALNNGQVYEEILDGLRAGEMLVTPELLAQLR